MTGENYKSLWSWIKIYLSFSEIKNQIYYFRIFFIHIFLPKKQHNLICLRVMKPMQCSVSIYFAQDTFLDIISTKYSLLKNVLDLLKSLKNTDFRCKWKSKVPSVVFGLAWGLLLEAFFKSICLIFQLQMSVIYEQRRAMSSQASYIY